MKLITEFLFLFSSILVLSNCGSAYNENTNNSINQSSDNMIEKDIIVKFVLRKEESSKDSNSETVKITITDEEFVLEKEYNGFKAPENNMLERKLKPGELKLILEFLEKHQLNTNLEEQKETGGIGVAGYLKIQVFHSETTDLSIEGKTNIWGADDYVKKNWGKKYVESRTNIENIEYFHKARSFISFIENLVKED